MKTLLRIAAAFFAFAACAITLHAGSQALGTTFQIYSSSAGSGANWNYTWSQLTSPSGKVYKDTTHLPWVQTNGTTNHYQTLDEVGNWRIDQYSQQTGQANPSELSSYPQFMAVTATTSTITTAVSPSAAYGGASGGGAYNNGSACTVTATPAAGYYFVSFTWDAPSGTGTLASSAGAGATTAVSYSFAVSTSRAIYANFQRRATYTLTLNANGSGSGSFTPSPFKYVFYQGDTVTVTAATAANSHLTSVSNGGGSQQVLTFGAANISLTATFDRNVASVSVNSASYTYDGSAKSVSATVSPAVAYAVTYNGSGAPPSSAGSYSAVATVTDPNWTGSGSGTLTINPAPASFSINGPFTYTGAPITAAIAASPAAATFVTGGTLTATAAGTYTATATANGNYSGADNALTWTINKANQVTVSLTPSSSSVAAGQSVTFSVSGGSGAGAFAWGGSASGTGSTAAVTFPNVGTYTVTVSRAGDGNYNASNTASATVTVGANPTTFTASGAFAYDGSPKTVTITPSPAGATYTTTGTVTATAAGTYSCTVTATGNFTGLATFSWTIAKATPVVSWAAPAAITYGTPLSATQLSATANTPGSFAYSPAAGAVLNVGANQTLSATFTPTDSANWNSATGLTVITVNPKALAFAANPTAFTYSRQSQGPTLSPSVSGATYAVTGVSTATSVGAYSLTVSGTGNYNGSSTVTWSIGPATPTVTWPKPAALVYGTPLSATQLNAAASDGVGVVAGTFVYTPGAGVVLGAGANQTLGVVFTPADTSNYRAASGGTTIDVSPATQAVTITPTSTSITAGGSVAFAASGGRNGYTWGGAASGSGTNATTQFSLPGAFQVSVFSPPGNGYLQSNTAVASISVNPAAQTVSITPAAVTVLPGQQTSIAASGGMNGYVWGGSATGSGAVAALTFGTPGDYGATVFSPAGGAFAQSNTAAATVSVRASQTIAFPAPGSFFLRTGGTTLSASASSGLPVRFTVVAGPGTLNGGRLNFSAIGVITVQADQDGNGSYAAAAPVRQTVYVTDPPATTLDFPGRTRLNLEGHQDSNAVLPEKP